MHMARTDGSGFQEVKKTAFGTFAERGADAADMSTMPH